MATSSCRGGGPAWRSPVDRRVAALIAGDGPLAVTEPVAMEVLAVARDDRREADLRRLLLRFELLRFDAAADFDAAPASTGAARGPE